MKQAIACKHFPVLLDIYSPFTFLKPQPRSLPKQDMCPCCLCSQQCDSLVVWKPKAPWPLPDTCVMPCVPGGQVSIPSSAPHHQAPGTSPLTQPEPETLKFREVLGIEEQTAREVAGKKPMTLVFLSV